MPHPDLGEPGLDRVRTNAPTIRGLRHIIPQTTTQQATAKVRTNAPTIRGLRHQDADCQKSLYHDVRTNAPTIRGLRLRSGCALDDKDLSGEDECPDDQGIETGVVFGEQFHVSPSEDECPDDQGIETLSALC